MERFSRTLHGYNPDEVNKFLDDTISQVEKIIESNKEKNEEIKELKERLNSKEIDPVILDKAKKYDDLSQTLSEAISLAQNTGEHIRTVARQERDLILEEARKDASTIINNAIKRSETIEHQANTLRKNIIKFKRKLRTNLEEQLKIIDKLDSIEKIDDRDEY